MYLRNAWYVAATSTEVSADNPLARTILNEPVVLFRTSGVQGATALEDRCNHRGAPLSLGFTCETGIVCGYHGLVFDRQGKCIGIPGQEHIPERARVRAYPLVERSGFCWLWMGEPQRADERLIPTIPRFTPEDDERPRFLHGVMHVKAGYSLVLENLMDLTHLAFVHRKTIGGHQEDHSGAEMTTTTTETGVQFSRLMRNALPPPDYATRYGYTGRIDRWEEFEYVAPATVLQSTGAVDVGKYDKGIRTGGHSLRAIHTFAPETDQTCFYFFSFMNDFIGAAGEPTLSSSVVLAEDAVVVEHQQQRLNGYDLHRLTAIASDGARVQMSRFLERKILEEQNDILAATR
jgi:phenylpropionate dioxygenase-like ring-hydroxylating dioxygenase large terminal subunit